MATAWALRGVAINCYIMLHRSHLRIVQASFWLAVVSPRIVEDKRFSNSAAKG